MTQIRCPHCLSPAALGQEKCPFCAKSLENKNPAGALPFAGLLAEKYTVGRLVEADGEGITYEGIGESKKWMRLETYGPKLVENIVQATSRDILAEAMLRLEAEGFEIVCHVHDEVVLEVPEGRSSVDEINEIMAVNPEWTDGLPLKAAWFESPFYKKD